jgi:uncharacterized membrane protein
MSGRGLAGLAIFVSLAGYFLLGAGEAKGAVVVDDEDQAGEESGDEERAGHHAHQTDSEASRESRSGAQQSQRTLAQTLQRLGLDSGGVKASIARRHARLQEEFWRQLIHEKIVLDRKMRELG